MTSSTGAWIGAGAGLVLAAIEYLVVMSLMRRQVQGEEPEAADRRLRPLQRIMMFAFVVLPILGFLLGNLLVEGGILPR